jgi:solute carrier family 13 (sodium-dependent dicarboxylate transporter), member 2/3/5
MQAGKISVGRKRPLAAVLRGLCAQWPPGPLFGLLLGPIAGLVIWWLPLGLTPTMHTALAIVGFMLVYWIAEPIDLGITALMGCLLFWLLGVTASTVAFSGFTNLSPWFVFGALLMGQAASRTGLAKRIGVLVLHKVGTSYGRLLFGLILLMFGLSFIISSANAQIATLGPLVVGIIAALGLTPHSNIAKGLFVTLTYTSTIFSKMFLSGGPSVLAQGIIAEQTGVQVQWSQWFLAFLPVALLTIGACWLIMRWLYPAEHSELSDGQRYLHEARHTLGPWSQDERKALCWLLLAAALWMTDFWHHQNPAAIAIGIGLLLALPEAGVLDTKAINAVNFLLIIFVAGSLSLGNVLTHTKALNLLTDHLGSWLAPLLSEAWRAAITLYWGGFLYHFLVGSEYTMVSTLLPALLRVADSQGYNPTLTPTRYM